MSNRQAACCGNCRFFYKPDEFEIETEGYCRRYPPVFNNMVDIEEVFYQPLVFRDDWCGEYQEREND